MNIKSFNDPFVIKDKDLKIDDNVLKTQNSPVNRRNNKSLNTSTLD